MPNANDRTKLTGDTHPPELEDGRAAAADDGTETESTPGKGENQAGFLKERDGMGTGRDKSHG